MITCPSRYNWRKVKRRLSYNNNKKQKTQIRKCCFKDTVRTRVFMAKISPLGFLVIVLYEYEVKIRNHEGRERREETWACKKESIFIDLFFKFTMTLLAYKVPSKR